MNTILKENITFNIIIWTQKLFSVGIYEYK